MLDRPCTVLIVAGSPTERDRSCASLDRRADLPWTCLEAATGASGLQLCREHRPDCVIVDETLPDMDGLGFLDALQAAQPQPPPVIVLTSGAAPDLGRGALRRGVHDVLAKRDLGSPHLRRAVEGAVERGGLLRRLAAREQALQESEARLHGVLGSMLDCFGIYRTVRGPQGQILDFQIDYVNDAACTANQLSREEQLGRSLCELLPAHRSSGLFDAYCRLVETGEPLARESLDYADRYAGRWLRRAFDIRATRLGDGFAATWRDITAQKRHEQSFSLLESASQTLIGSLDYRQTVSQVARLVVPRLADVCAVYLRNGQSGLERLAVAFADPALAELDQRIQETAPLRWDQLRIIRDVLESGESLLLSKVDPAAQAEQPGNAQQSLLRQIPS